MKRELSMVLCLLLLPGMAGAGTGADSPEKKTASAVNNKRNVRQKITPVGTRKSIGWDRSFFLLPAREKEE